MSSERKPTPTMLWRAESSFTQVTVPPRLMTTGFGMNMNSLMRTTVPGSVVVVDEVVAVVVVLVEVVARVDVEEEVEVVVTTAVDEVVVVVCSLTQPHSKSAETNSTIISLIVRK